MKVFNVILTVALLHCVAVFVNSEPAAVSDLLEERAAYHSDDERRDAASTLYKKSPRMKNLIKQKAAWQNDRCEKPACPAAPSGCTFSFSNEEDENGCPKYPCGINLVCDSGTTYEPTNSKDSKTLTNCIENENPNACENVCSSTPHLSNSFLVVSSRTKPSLDQSRANLLGREESMTLFQLNAKEGGMKGGKGGRRRREQNSKSQQEQNTKKQQEQNNKKQLEAKEKKKAQKAEQAAKRKEAKEKEKAQKAEQAAKTAAANKKAAKKAEQAAKRKEAKKKGKGPKSRTSGENYCCE